MPIFRAISTTICRASVAYPFPHESLARTYPVEARSGDSKAKPVLPSKCLLCRDSIKYGPTGQRDHSASLKSRNEWVACKLVWRGHANKRVTSASLAYLEKMASASSRCGLRRMSLLVSTLSNMGVHGTAKVSVEFSDRSETSFTSFVIMAPTSFSAENATSGLPFFLPSGYRYTSSNW